jgi:hypothetical protein
MICTLCENEVTTENELGLCSSCNNTFIAGLHEYKFTIGGNEDEKDIQSNKNNG